jgi:hypothetical protein
MLQPTVIRRGLLLLGLFALSGVLMAGNAGCLNIGGDEPLVRVESSPEPAPVDTTRIPPVNTVEEGRQRLAEAYQRIGYLERELDGANRDKAELKADVKKAKQERDRYKDRLESLQGD